MYSKQPRRVYPQDSGYYQGTDMHKESMTAIFSP